MMINHPPGRGLHKKCQAEDEAQIVADGNRKMSTSYWRNIQGKPSIIELDDGKSLTGKPYIIFDGKNHGFR